MAGYDFTAIQTKWQAYWAEHRTFQTPNPGEPGFVDRPKFYVLDMFPYPSGAGLHVGHPEGYTATDIIARYKRMSGYNVLHPMGYDAFGLPAEQYAVEHGIHPRKTTEANIANIERQIKMFGFSYDWSRRVSTTDVEYYKWTQWIFLQLFNSWYDPDANAARPISELINRLQSGELVADLNGNVVRPPISGTIEAMAGVPGGIVKFAELAPDQRSRLIDEYRLAYQAEVPVNWCPALGTVLANEEVTNEGRSERGNHPVYRRPLKQWMLRITAYAERLEIDLDQLDWPEPIKIMQRNWIGKSVGAEVDFPLESADGEEWFAARRDSRMPGRPEEDVIRVYTTRPDTLFGATYMVLAPEHPLVDEITTPEQRQAVGDYVAQAARKSEMDRTAESKQKTGVFTGAYAINPINRQRTPIWVADYVMMGYGTGAIMAVPAHDTRDFEFAKQYGLPVTVVVIPDQATALRLPIATNYSYEGPITDEPSEAEWGAIADSIIELFQRGELIFAGGPDGSAVVMNPDGRPLFVVAMLEFAGLRGKIPPEVRKKFIKMVTARAREGYSSFTADGVAINSGPYDGLSTPEFKARITEDLYKAGAGRQAVNYKLHDWLFSRQRYWGEPFPIIHCERCGIVALPESALPLELPEMEDFTPASSDDPNALPSPPLGKIADWVSTTCPLCGGPATRELNTMPQWAGSCWYFLRYLDPRNSQRFVSPEAERYWMQSGGVDLYVGGAEHAVLHLLYARFWHKVLFDLGHVSTVEPFHKLFNQGMIRSFAYTDSRGMYLGYDDIDFREDGPFHKTTGERLNESVEKMSKSLKNVVNPDKVISEYGADTFRLYEMFMGPLEASKPWNTRDVPGVHRFLQRVWRMVAGTDEQPALVTDGAGDAELERSLHKMIKKVGGDIEAMRFNTAIAAMMEFINLVYKAGTIGKRQAQRFVLVLAPLAPHIAEELWQRLGHDESLAYEPFPQYDESLTVDSTIEIPVQVNGKVRGRVSVPADATQEQVLAAALADEKVSALVAGKRIVKQIVVPGRLVNIVAQ